MGTCKIAYTIYFKTLLNMSDFLRGVKYDENVFLNETTIIYDITTGMCITCNFTKT